MKRRVRRTWIAGGAVAVLLVAAAATWFVWLPNYRPPLRPGEEYGIDVSHHQGPIDWDRVAEDGIRFAYIKATEGGDHRDDRFAENWRRAAEAGIERGAYHFFTLCRPGAIQADNFLRAVPDVADALPPAVDLEFGGNCSARPQPADFRQELQAFLDAVELSTGQTALIYVHRDFDDFYGVRDHFRRPLWHARFLRRPDVAGWVVWQVMGVAYVDGIDGRVDLDVRRPPDSSA